MSRPLRGFMRDDGAVSNVVAAVLTFALIMMVLVVVRVEFVPTWEKDREADHMLEVQGQLLGLTAEAQKQAGNRTGGLSVTTPVTLSQAEKFRYFTGSGLPGTLMFDPRSDQSSNLSSDELLVFTQNGGSMFGIDENWTEITSGSSLDSIVSIQHLRMRVNSPGEIAGPPHGQDKGGITLTLKDRDDAFAGDIRVYVMSHASGYNVNTKVRDAQQTVLYDQGTAHFGQDQPEMYWVDALTSERQFVSVLSKAEPPWTLEWSQDGLTGHYTISYQMEDANGTTQVGGSGLVVKDWESEQGGGALMFSSKNRYFLDQTHHFEHGAVILEQHDGATMVGSPHFRPSLVGDQTQISFASIGLTGDPDEVSSGRTVPVELVPKRQTSLSASAASFTWDYPTSFPDLWADFWRDRLVSAGLDEGAGEFLITTGPERATLTVYGTDADPQSTDHDLSLKIIQSTLEVVLSP